MTPKPKKKPSDITVIDNFLDKDDFIELKEIWTHENTTWNLTPGISADDSTNAIKNPLDNYMFNHLVYKDNRIFSDAFEKVYSILHPHMNEMFGNAFRVITRIKVNMYTRTHEVQNHPWHVDSQDIVGLRGLLLCFNTCDGYTGFDDGTEINSVENRGILFDATERHHSTSCSNAPYRLNMNINYV